MPGAGCQTLDRVAQTPPRMPPLVKRLYSVQQAGEYLNLSSWGIRELIWNGKLPYIKVGKRRIAVDIRDLDTYIEEQKTREWIR